MDASVDTGMGAHAQSPGGRFGGVAGAAAFTGNSGTPAHDGRGKLTNRYVHTHLPPNLYPSHCPALVNFTFVVNKPLQPSPSMPSNTHNSTVQVERRLPTPAKIWPHEPPWLMPLPSRSPSPQPPTPINQQQQRQQRQQQQHYVPPSPITKP